MQYAKDYNICISIEMQMTQTILYSTNTCILIEIQMDNNFTIL